MSPLFLLSLLLIVSLLFVSLHAENIHDHQRSVANESSKTTSKPCPKPHFVLVHGYGGGAWSWYKIQSLMEASGFKVTSLDLKGAGTDPTDSRTVNTFDVYNKPLIDFLTKLPDDKKVILVGFSAGGVSVTDASHKFSRKIYVAVYVAATMLKHGFVTEQDIEDGVPANVRRPKMNPKLRRARYYHTSNIGKCPQPKIAHIISQEDEVLSKILFRPVPIEAVLSARFEGDEAEGVKRVYIKTLYDQELLPLQQNAMIQRWPPSEVFMVQADHGIIFTDPFILFGLLVKITITNMCN